jgi:predicted DNA-binding antitoxin AbrB/MazE fold protein
MIRQTCEAVFEDGIFRILPPYKIVVPEGQKVRLVVETAEPPEDVLELATHVYAGFSEEQIDEIEQIILDRSKFFSGRTLA